jgi:hypothetical protein
VATQRYWPNIADRANARSASAALRSAIDLAAVVNAMHAKRRDEYGASLLLARSNWRVARKLSSTDTVPGSLAADPAALPFRAGRQTTWGEAGPPAHGGL